MHHFWRVIQQLAEKENALIEKQNDLEKAESEIARLKKLLENAGISS